MSDTAFNEFLPDREQLLTASKPESHSVLKRQDCISKDAQITQKQIKKSLGQGVQSILNFRKAHLIMIFASRNIRELGRCGTPFADLHGHYICQPVSFQTTV